MSNFLQRMQEEQQASQPSSGTTEEVKMSSVAENDDDYDSEEEKADMMSDLPVSYPGAAHIDANVHAPVDSAMAQLGGGSGSSGAAAASSSSMPMPAGLIPVGNAVSATGMPKPDRPNNMPKAPNALAALRNNYEPLPWTDFYDSTEKINDMVPVYIAGTEGHVFVCLHGAGHSAMSFARLAETLKPTSTIVAFDWRGHGTHEREDAAEMSQETLVADTLQVLHYTNQKFANRTIILVGHSMGGAIATKTMAHIEASQGEELAELKKCILGVIIIDVVEGTAMDALPFMEQIVKSRPVHFPDLASVVKYGVMGGQVRDKKSARVSMPAQVKEVVDGPTGLKKYVWRTDLLATKQFWTQWFTGLTSTFLGLQAKKMLFLAGAERQDTELTIAHMQGKYEMNVIADCGHVIQEDQPQMMCTKIMDFIQRRRIPVEYNQQMFIITAGGKKVFIGH